MSDTFETIAVLFDEKHHVDDVLRFVRDLRDDGELRIEVRVEETTVAPFGIRVSVPSSASLEAIAHASQMIREWDVAVRAEPDLMPHASKRRTFRIRERVAAMMRPARVRAANETISRRHEPQKPTDRDDGHPQMRCFEETR